MERVLLFDTPIRIDCDSPDQEENTVVTVFGLRLLDSTYEPSELAGYIGYLVAAQKWNSLGGDVDLNTWTTKEGITYGLFDAEILEFTKQANQEFTVSSKIYETTIDLSGLAVADCFVVDVILANRIREEGLLMDVRMPPSRCVRG